MKVAVGVLFCLINAALTCNAQTDQIVTGSREAISRDIIVLRDSVNNTLNILQKNSTMAADQHHSKVIQDLTQNKVKLDKAIDEIVNAKTWNKELGDRTVHVIDDVRKEYRRIKDDLKSDDLKDN
ncbi:hypothetical protein [Pseudochryseolinea flava]|uniref:Uncharacterized protein n=1 Tax=Pseudochryseolinea flava TaxID=2059302 RepID=A0A364Y5Z5_9BACT|nr:hypothetical protein [Pseudochryseolinea flava]RAW01781.1 hypothetical protein DQQ10_09040 [Pseudochryseolinea flava]